MASISKAALTTENNSSIVTAVLPESITPVILGALLQDIIDSMWNKIDGITVDGITVPASFSAIIHDGDQLNDIIQNLLDWLNTISPTAPLQAGYGFQAMQTQIFEAEASGTYMKPNVANAHGAGQLILFPDDNVNGYDNGNNFFTSKFIAPVAMTGSFAPKFVLENVIAYHVSDESSATHFTVKIIHWNGLAETVLATKAITISAADDIVALDYLETATVDLSANDEVYATITISDCNKFRVSGCKFSNKF